MKVRQAVDEDIPNIVSLLKMSLGEGLMPKSEAYWRWKHNDNPFGRSPVLVAEESGQLIGVRAFMRWEWTDGEKVYKAVRAVDTATHPAHQGKGIFKKLTLQLVEECRQEGVHFIYNTPNAQSRPGYLKMDWKDAGRLPVRLQIANPFSALIARLRNVQGNDTPLEQLLQGVTEAVCKRESNVSGHVIASNYSKAYLHWRYCRVPVAQYHGVLLENDRNGELLIYRLKESKMGKELRVTDLFSSLPEISPTAMKLLHKRASIAGATHLTFSGIGSQVHGGLMLNKGPRVTIRDIQFPGFSGLDKFHNWQPSLGDLELF